MYGWAVAHRSDTVYFGQPDAPGQDGRGGACPGACHVPGGSLGRGEDGGGSMAKNWGGSPIYKFNHF